MSADVARYLGSSPIALAINLYPYALPEDVRQDIIWLQDTQTPKKEIFQFMDRVMSLRGLKVDDVIIFERPLKTRSLLVKGSFPEYRHVHFWNRLKI
jgi:hypothetical protein